MNINDNRSADYLAGDTKMLMQILFNKSAKKMATNSRNNLPK